MKNIGTFEVTSGQIRISDPCYDNDAVGTFAHSIAARNGTWDAWVQLEEAQVAELIVVRQERSPIRWRRGDCIGVDSGTAGVFDESAFRVDAGIPHEPMWSEEPGDLWYYKHVVQDQFEAKSITGGVISRTGWGDGIYKFQWSRSSEGTAEAVRIIFF